MSRFTGLLLVLGMVCLGCSPPEGDVERPSEGPAVNETTPGPSLNETVPPSEPVAPVEEPAEEPAPPMEIEKPMPAPAEEEATLPPSVEPAKPAETPAEEPAPPAEEPAPPAEEMKKEAKPEEPAAPAEAATEVDVEAAVQPTPAESVEGLLEAEAKPEAKPEAKEEPKEEPKDEPMPEAVEAVEPVESPQTSQPAEQAQAEQAKMEKPAETEKEAASGPVTTKLTPDNTLIQFVGIHVGDKPDPRTGRFTKFQGEAKAADGKLSSVAVEIETASLETEIEKLTNHLKSPDFFDARQHPKASFKSTKIEPGDGGTVSITGDLTLLGETKSITFPAKVTIEDQVNLTAEFPIDRTQFGMNYGTDNVDKEVAMTIKVGK